MVLKDQVLTCAPRSLNSIHVEAFLPITRSSLVVLVGQLVDNADLPQERKEPVKKDVLHLKFSASSSTDKAFCSLIEKQLTEQGLSVADSNALLAELASMSD
ncbi:hypothetical protein WJX77_002830 [Trebouxia sp. C0004]